MEIVKSYDSRMNDIWRVMDGLKTVAICYSEKKLKSAEMYLRSIKQTKSEKKAIHGGDSALSEHC